MFKDLMNYATKQLYFIFGFRQSSTQTYVLLPWMGLNDLCIFCRQGKKTTMKLHYSKPPNNLRSLSLFNH